MPNLLAILCVFCTVVLFAYFAIKVMRPIAFSFGLVDSPSVRKNHQGKVPLIGGISIFIAVVATMVIWLPITQELRLYLFTATLMVFIGAADDQFDLRVEMQLMGQLSVASFFVFGGTSIHSLGYILPSLNIELSWLGIPFTYFIIVVAINAFNMIDGIDGLVGALSINTFVSIAILFIFQGNYGYSYYALILASAILPYLMFNLGSGADKSKKIFMGDAGSMFLGMSVVWLLIQGSQDKVPSFNPVTALYLTAIPLMDMLAVVIRRISKGRSPLKADRDHLHHILIRLGYSQKQALVFILLMAVLSSLIGIFGEVFQIIPSFMLLVFVLIFAIYYWALRRLSIGDFFN